MKNKKSVLTEKFNIEFKDVKKATLFIRAVDNKLRWKMLELLSERELTVTQLIKILKKDQSAISSYLAVLRKEGLVEYRREHKNVYYKIKESNMEFFNHIISLIKNYKAQAFLKQVMQGFFQRQVHHLSGNYKRIGNRRRG